MLKGELCRPWARHTRGVAPQSSKRTLELPGSTALDPAKVVRIRIGLTPARVIEVGPREDKSRGKDGQTRPPRAAFGR